MNRNFNLVALLLLLALVSCRSSRDLIFFQDVVKDTTATVIDNRPDYHIKSNDNLYVNIRSLDPEISRAYNPSQDPNDNSGGRRYGDPAMQYVNGFMVDSLGSISLPILGKITVGGLTLQEAENKVKKLADKHLKDASVKVRLLNFKVSVMGEVKVPGVYYNYAKNFTILEAISMAQGITSSAKSNKVKVFRTVKGIRTFYVVDLTTKELFNSKAFFLEPNDVIYVEPHEIKKFDVNSGFYSLMLSAISTVVLIVSLIVTK